LLRIDGTDFRMPNWGEHFFSHKFNGIALHYEVGLSIQLGEICWTYEPKPPRLYNDLQIFRMGLMLELDPNEKVVADGVYRAEAPHRVKDPHTIFPFATKRRRQGSAVDMLTSIDISRNGVILANNGNTSFMSIRMYSCHCLFGTNLHREW